MGVLAYAHAEHEYEDAAHGRAMHRFPAHTVKEQDEAIARYVAAAHPQKVFLLDEDDNPRDYACPVCGYPHVDEPVQVTALPEPEQNRAIDTPRMAPGRRATAAQARKRSRIARTS